MIMEIPLTDKQADELARYSANGSLRPGGWELPGNRRVAAALWKMGLLERFENTEQVRGERRAVWFEYRKPKDGFIISRLTTDDRNKDTR
jgi:hypothetical protein